jgi:hypothetical protein
MYPSAGSGLQLQKIWKNSAFRNVHKREDKMKPLNSKSNANLMVLNLAFCCLIALFYSCGSGGGGDSAAAFGKGSVGFSLALDNPAAARAVSFRAAADAEVQFACEDYQIATIEAQVVDKNGAVLVEGSWACDEHQATISGITPGDGIVVKVFGRDADGVVLFEGQSDELIVVAGQTTDAGIITLTSINERLAGDFIGTSFGSGYWVGLSDLISDGLGNGNFEDLLNTYEFLRNGTLTYNVTVDGSLTSTFSTGEVFGGILNAGGDILAAADTDFTDDSIEFDVAVKTSAGLSNATLSGEYIGVRISDGLTTALTQTNFDGQGGGTYQILAASDPSLVSSQPSEFTYTVDPANGRAAISGGENAADGIVNSDGTVASMVDTSSRGPREDNDMTVLIKAGSGLSNATVNGDYTAVSFGYSLGEGFDEVTSRMSISADGVGNMEITILSNSNGESGSFEATYTVNPDGRIRIIPPDKEFLDGIVNGEGGIFTFVNTSTSDNFIEIGVAIKETP